MLIWWFFGFGGCGVKVVSNVRFLDCRMIYCVVWVVDDELIYYLWKIVSVGDI